MCAALSTTMTTNSPDLLYPHGQDFTTDASSCSTTGMSWGGPLVTKNWSASPSKSAAGGHTWAQFSSCSGAAQATTRSSHFVAIGWPHRPIPPTAPNCLCVVPSPSGSRLGAERVGGVNGSQVPAEVLNGHRGLWRTRPGLEGELRAHGLEWPRLFGAGGYFLQRRRRRGAGNC